MNIVKLALELGATKAEIKGVKYPSFRGTFSTSADASAFALLFLEQGFKARARRRGDVIVRLRRPRGLILRR